MGLEAAGRSERIQREQAFATRMHNCMVDCDYPSQCHHERYRLHTEAVEKKLLEAVTEKPQSPPIVASVPMNPDDELLLNEAIEVREYEDVGDEQKSPTSPKSPLRQTSFFLFDDPDEVDVPDEEEKPQVDNEGRKKRKTKTPKNQRSMGEQDEADHSAVDINDMTLQRLIEEDGKMMPLEFLEANVVARCRSRMSNREHPKHSGKLTVRNLTDADKEDEWDHSSDSDSDTSSSLSPTSSSCSDGEWLSASELTSASEDSSTRANRGESDDETDEELDALVAAEKSFLRD